MQQEGETQFSIVWRGRKFVLEMNPSATLKDLGTELQKQTNVRTDTMRLIVSSRKNSKMLYPFAEEHSYLSLEAASILKGKSIRMMGVPQDEVDEVLQNSKVDLRVAGFDEEEDRMRKRMLRGQQLPQVPRGTYIFCDFRTLQIPGIEGAKWVEKMWNFPDPLCRFYGSGASFLLLQQLNPPASEALKLMHRLAADPGILAIMNKHRWRVGIMTEMAPVGYVGVSPKCILGFNKNHGEEISLRLRTDDLRGFRKYESIKKTLLHELAHMVHSEHDANFYALNKQLNEEAAALDWTKSRSHTLSGVKYTRSNEAEFDIDNSASLSRKLGGQSFIFPNARASSVAAAYQRLASSSVDLPEASGEEPDPDDDGFDEFDHAAALEEKELNIMNVENPEKLNHVLKHDDQYCNKSAIEFEPDPDAWHSCEAMKPEARAESGESGITSEPDPDDCEMTIPCLETELGKVPGPDNSEVSLKHGTSVGQHCSGIALNKEDLVLLNTTIVEPIPKDVRAGQNDMECEHLVASNKNHAHTFEATEVRSQVDTTFREPDLHDSQGVITEAKADHDDIMQTIEKSATQHTDEPVLDDQELQRIQDPVSIVCGRLQKAIALLKSEVIPTEATRVLQTLLKIVRNVIEHPDEVKFKRLRKANPLIQRNILNYKAAMEIISLTGFTEDVIFDEFGKSETYFVLKHNDPGRLWLAKSSLETHIA